jgi:predicted N-formylglutamate amidohydrolase
MSLLAPDEAPPVTIDNPGGGAPCLLLCEHASNRLPRALGDLGLPPGEIDRHIGWDIGALVMARELSRLLDAPLISTGYSRLAIDCNRPLDAPSSIPERSEDTVVPGNIGLAPADRLARQQALFHPFERAVAAHLDARGPCAVFGVHSFTPVFRGVARPWEAGFLYASAHRLAAPLIEGLRAQGFCVGDNEPYRIDPAEDYTVPVHGEARGLPALLIEIRQDLVGDLEGAVTWALRLAPLLREACAAALPASGTARSAATPEHRRSASTPGYRR